MTRTTPPATPLVSLAEAKSQLRLSTSFTVDDTIVGRLIDVATQQAEGETGRAFITQTWRATYDALCPGGLMVPRVPVASVEEVTYLAEATGIETVLSVDAWRINLDEEPGRLLPAFGTAWPAVRSQEGAVAVEFVAGYGDDPEDVPADLRHAVLMLVHHYYEQREIVVVGTIVAEIPMTAQRLLEPYRVHWFMG